MRRITQPEQEPSMAYKVWMCPRQDCASSRKCTSFVACSSRAYLEPERSTVKQTLTVKQDDNAHPEYVRGYSAGLEASAISEQKSAQPEPVIDKSAAIRIATSLGWEPKRKPLTDEQWQVMADTLGCLITRTQKDAIEAVIGIKE